MVLFRAFLGGATDPSVLDETDDALVAIATRDLSSVLGISGPPQLVTVHRWRDAGAQHNVGHAARLDRMIRRLELLPGSSSPEAASARSASPTASLTDELPERWQPALRTKI